MPKPAKLRLTGYLRTILRVERIGFVSLTQPYVEASGQRFTHACITEKTKGIERLAHRFGMIDTGQDVIIRAIAIGETHLYARRVEIDSNPPPYKRASKAALEDAA